MGGRFSIERELRTTVELATKHFEVVSAEEHGSSVSPEHPENPSSDGASVESREALQHLKRSIARLHAFVADGKLPDDL